MCFIEHLWKRLQKKSNELLACLLSVELSVTDREYASISCGLEAIGKH